MVEQGAVTAASQLQEVMEALAVGLRPMAMAPAVRAMAAAVADMVVASQVRGSCQYTLKAMYLKTPCKKINHFL
jgi:hypothetical protein